MLLLRGIVSHAADRTVCTAFFGATEVGLLGGEHAGLPGALALELMAQTMAVHDGLRRRAEQRPAVSRGFLLGSRRLDLFTRTLPAGEALRVVAAGENAGGASGGLVRFTGRVEDARGRLLACGDVSVLEHRPDPA